MGQLRRAGCRRHYLIAIILAWGACPTTAACPADVYPANCGNGQVTVDDLITVITSWGDCPGTPPEEGGIAGIPESYFDCEDLCAGKTGRAMASVHDWML